MKGRDESQQRATETARPLKHNGGCLYLQRVQGRTEVKEEVKKKKREERAESSQVKEIRGSGLI
jgi:hypothetical protein